MKKNLVSTLLAGVMLAGLASPAFAQDGTPKSPAPGSIRAQAGPAQLQRSVPGGGPSGSALMWTGAGVFVGGMGVALYGFLNNKNGEFPEFGEAAATDNRLGGAGLAAAFAGGALMAIGHRVSRHAPDIQMGVGRFSVTKRITW
jgi:hypothetical protein